MPNIEIETMGDLFGWKKLGLVILELIPKKQAFFGCRILD